MEEANSPEKFEEITDDFNKINFVLPPLPEDRPNAKISHKQFNEFSAHNLRVLAEHCLALYDMIQKQQADIDELQEKVKDLKSKRNKKNEDSNL